MPRMNILNAVEREAFDSPPVFHSFQRKQYFDFPSKLRRFAAGLRSPAYRVGFLLSAGYFKAVKRFFSPGAFHRRDIEYVTRQLELGVPMVDLASYHPRARQRHQFTIRTFYGRPCGMPPPAQRDRRLGAIRSQTQGHLLALCRCSSFS
jgi:hypothetical protein